MMQNGRINLQTLELPCCLYLSFIVFCNIYLSTIIYTTHLLANNEIKGIDNPLARVGCNLLVHLCVATEDGCGLIFLLVR